MRKIRRNLFESNSSETHAFAIVTEDIYNEWSKGGYYLHIDDIESSSSCLNFNDAVPSRACTMSALLPYRLEGKYIYTPQELKEYITDKKDSSERYDENRSLYPKILEYLDRVISGELGYSDFGLCKMLISLNFFVPTSLPFMEEHEGVRDIDAVEEHKNGMVLLGYFGDV